MKAESDVFGDVKTHWDEVVETRWGQYISEIERRALLAAQSTFRQPGAGFEVGCGGGRWVRLLSDLGWAMTATDIGADVVRLCQSRNPSSRCILVRADEKRFPVDSASMDLVLCIEVPQLDWNSYASEAARVLRPGGKLVGCQPNALSWRGVLVNIKSAIRRSKRHYFVTYPALRRALRKNGFVMHYACGCCWAPFGRHSNSRLIPIAATIERMTGLRRLTAVSPWVVYSAIRS
jgi:SAM-dependent methyltransferase